MYTTYVHVYFHIHVYTHGYVCAACNIFMHKMSYYWSACHKFYFRFLVCTAPGLLSQGSLALGMWCPRLKGGKAMMQHRTLAGSKNARNMLSKLRRSEERVSEQRPKEQPQKKAGAIRK